MTNPPIEMNPLLAAVTHSALARMLSDSAEIELSARGPTIRLLRLDKAGAESFVEGIVTKAGSLLHYFAEPDPQELVGVSVAFDEHQLREGAPVRFQLVTLSSQPGQEVVYILQFLHE